MEVAARRPVGSAPLKCPLAAGLAARLRVLEKRVAVLERQSARPRTAATAAAVAAASTQTEVSMDTRPRVMHFLLPSAEEEEEEEEKEEEDNNSAAANFTGKQQNGEDDSSAYCESNSAAAANVTGKQKNGEDDSSAKNEEDDCSAYCENATANFTDFTGKQNGEDDDSTAYYEKSGSSADASATANVTGKQKNGEDGHSAKDMEEDDGSADCDNTSAAANFTNFTGKQKKHGEDDYSTDCEKNSAAAANFTGTEHEKIDVSATEDFTGREKKRDGGGADYVQNDTTAAAVHSTGDSLVKGLPDAAVAICAEPVDLFCKRLYTALKQYAVGTVHFENVDVSGSRWTVDAWNQLFTIVQDSGASVRRLKAYKCGLDDECMSIIAKWLRKQHIAASVPSEIHLSHNAISQKGLLDLLSALELQRAHSRRRRAVPIWPRIENNLADIAIDTPLIRDMVDERRATFAVRIRDVVPGSAVVAVAVPRGGGANDIDKSSQGRKRRPREKQTWKATFEAVS